MASATREAATRVRADHIDRVHATAWAAWECLDIGWRDVGLSNRCTRIQLVLHRILLLRRIDLFQVRDAGVLSAGGPSLNKVRDRDCHENSDDQHDDHDFDESKCSPRISLHIVLLASDNRGRVRSQF